MDTLLQFFRGKWLDDLTPEMMEDFKSARLREKRGNATQLASMLGHTKNQMTMRYVHPAEEERRAAAGKLETFRVEGRLQAVKKAVEKSKGLPTNGTTNTRPN
jgi:hypothetical protein